MTDQYRHFAFGSPAGTSRPCTGHHYLSETDKNDQWRVMFYPRGSCDRPFPHVEISVLVSDTANQWETRAVVGTGPASPVPDVEVTEEQHAILSHALDFTLTSGASPGWREVAHSTLTDVLFTYMGVLRDEINGDTGDIPRGSEYASIAGTLRSANAMLPASERIAVPDEQP